MLHLWLSPRMARVRSICAVSWCRAFSSCCHPDSQLWGEPSSCGLPVEVSTLARYRRLVNNVSTSHACSVCERRCAERGTSWRATRWCLLPVLCSRYPPTFLYQCVWVPGTHNIFVLLARNTLQRRGPHLLVAELLFFLWISSPRVWNIMCYLYQTVSPRDRVHLSPCKPAHCVNRVNDRLRTATVPF